MKKRTLIVGMVVAFAVIFVGVVSLLPEDSKSSNAQNERTSPPQKVSAACRLFTLADATAILGTGTKLAPGTDMMDAVSEISDISACRYVTGTSEDAKSATVLIRLAKTTKGIDYNKSIFGENRPAGNQTVNGVGDAAFWDEAVSQLNVLKGDTWYNIENMDGMQAGSGTLDTSRAIYDQLKSKL
jgi:hypothetical protein